jgi:hypothetical protein
LPVPELVDEPSIIDESASVEHTHHHHHHHHHHVGIGMGCMCCGLQSFYLAKKLEPWLDELFEEKDDMAWIQGLLQKHEITVEQSTWMKDLFVHKNEGNNAQHADSWWKEHLSKGDVSSSFHPDVVPEWVKEHGKNDHKYHHHSWHSHTVTSTSNFLKKGSTSVKTNLLKDGKAEFDEARAKFEAAAEADHKNAVAEAQEKIRFQHNLEHKFGKASAAPVKFNLRGHK